MGGNALKNVATVRLPAARYHALCVRVLDTLRQHWPAAQAQLVRSMHAKADFGDMDVLLDESGMPPDVSADLVALFGCREIVRNGSIFSCDVDSFQLDLIWLPSRHFACAVDYFAWNDAGNLMGRVARRLGFKYGHQGLSYQLRDGDYLVADLEVCTRMPEVFAFLGYDQAGADYLAYQRGFDVPEAMFSFVASSRFFDPTAYALESRSHQARTRDRKRTVYRAFLRWLEDRAVPAGPESGQPYGTHLKRALLVFPQFARELAAARDRLALLRERRARFNGASVQAWTGLEGKALGALMSRCRNGFSGGPQAFDAYVLEASEDELREYVRTRLVPDT